MEDTSCPDRAQELFSYLCQALYARLHFLALPLGSLIPDARPDIELIGTDGARLLYNSGAMLDLLRQNEDTALLYLLHQILHCLLGHPFVSGVDPKLWNPACDLTVWKVAEELYPRPKTGGFPIFLSSGSLTWKEISSHLPAANDVTAPLLCRLLTQDDWLCLHREEIDRLVRADDHRFWLHAKRDASPNCQNGREGNISSSQASASEQLRLRWQSMKPSLNRELHRLRRSRGTAEASLRTALTLTEEHRWHYRDFLLRFASMQENAKVNPNEFSYAYYQMNIDEKNRVRLIEPLEYTEETKLAELAIVIDTSGSCSGELVRIFLEETRNILLREDLFFSRFHLEIIQCDNRVQRADRIRSCRDFEQYIRSLSVSGGGGTDYRPAFSYIDSLIAAGSFSHLKGLLYFTDGCGLYPREMPSYETAFVFLEDRYDDIDVPDWALKLVLPLAHKTMNYHTPGRITDEY